jgi:penicillin amidase
MKPIRLRNVRREIAVSRDAQGVPHIQAACWTDALYGLGYLHAWDRGTQLSFARTVASGRAAEELADDPELLETDAFFRRIGLHLDLDREIQALDPDILLQLAAYCDGINDGLRGSGRSLPMWATGFQPTDWDEQSVLLIGKLLSFGGLAISQMQNERLLMELIHAGAGDQALRDLFGSRLDGADLDLLRQVKMANRLSDDALELLTDLPRLAGSNAWAVAPHRSASGHALLASDPHLEINRLPAIWYEAVLRWGDEYVMGATLPGCPLFAVARTPRLAWGVTYMKGDTVDYFVEECRLAEADETARGSRWQYRRGDQWLDFRVRNEVVHRKGETSEALSFLENEQGTLESSLEKLEPGYHLSLAWSGSQPGNGRAIRTWLDVVSAPDAARAMDIVQHCQQPTLCWVFADNRGHIGLQGCGRFPRRGGGHVGLTPIPAWETANHWQGWLPTSVLPREYDPPQGFVATANEARNPTDEPLLSTQPLSDYRYRRIQECLRELPQATVQDMQQLQYDLVSLQARDLLALWLPDLPDGPIRHRLEQWDCRFTADSREAAMFQRLYRYVMMEALGQDTGIGWRRMLYLCSRAGFSLMVLTSADHLLLHPDAQWWHRRDRQRILDRAVQRLEQDPDQPWSEINNFHFTDRFFGGHQVGRILGFNSRRFAMSGNHTTIFHGHVLQTATRESTFAPSYHFVTDLGTDEAWTNLTGGPSESRFSKYYNIDVQNWFHGRYKRLVGTAVPSD